MATLSQRADLFRKGLVRGQRPKQAQRDDTPARRMLLTFRAPQQVQ
jgi:hypothetical protein